MSLIRRNDKFKAAIELGYYADDEGTIYRDCIPVPLYDNAGRYLAFVFRYGVHTYRVYVHRFVWEYFNGPIPEKMQIDHKNYIRDDNRLKNLRCVTSQENIRARKAQRRQWLTERGIE